MRRPWILAVTFGFLPGLTSCLGASPSGDTASSTPVERRTCRASDGVEIVYSAAGSGDLALVFVHGGLADRHFYDGQLEAFAGQYRVVALDLAGHGESGSNRTKWGLPQFGGDVQAVVEAEKLDRVILFGNSLGGPTVVEAALLLPGRVLGVVGIDTFQSIDRSISEEAARERAEAIRADYPGAVKEMVRSLFHPDTRSQLVADAEHRMQKTPPDAAYEMFVSLGGYRTADAVKKLEVPLRAINGDLFPTDVEGARRIKPDFDAIVMKHIGHYPMLERPAEFNRHVAALARELGKR